MRLEVLDLASVINSRKSTAKSTCQIYYQTAVQLYCAHSIYYLAHAYNASGECHVFTMTVLPSVHKGGGGAPGTSTF